MKVQIRRSVFETNSSSVHTVTLARFPENITVREIIDSAPDYIKEDIKNNGLYFGRYQDSYLSAIKEDIPEELKIFRIKVDDFYRNVLERSSERHISLVFKFLKFIKDFCGKYDIRYEINCEEEFISRYDYGWCDSNYAEELIGDEVNFARFIFNPLSEAMSYDNNYFYEDTSKFTNDKVELFLAEDC